MAHLCFTWPSPVMGPTGPAEKSCLALTHVFFFIISMSQVISFLNPICRGTRLRHAADAPLPPPLIVLQKRCKKPVDSAQTRLERRTLDRKLDKLCSRLRKLQLVLQVHDLMRRGRWRPYVSVQLMSRWKRFLGLKVGMGVFLRKYPHVFDLFMHSIKKNPCCRIRPGFRKLVGEEHRVTKECELDGVQRVKRLLMLSRNGFLHIQALRLIRKELGLPPDFRDSILSKHSDLFRLRDLETVEMVGSGEESSEKAEIEKWREKEYKEKWLSEFETKYAFPLSFPTGYVIGGGMREKIGNWQRAQYLKPYETKDVSRVGSHGGRARYEKRAVAMIHELLSLTVEKRVEMERLSHFRKEFCMMVNVRELLLKHQGIFYISTKGKSQIVFLREAYHGGSLISENPIHVVRMKMMELLVLGRRNTRKLKENCGGEIKQGNCSSSLEDTKLVMSSRDLDGGWVVPILLSSLGHKDGHSK